VAHSPVAAVQLSIFLLTALISLVISQPGDYAVPDPALREKLLAEKRTKLQSLPGQAYPHLAETADYFLGPPADHSCYERGLAAVLNGVRLA
jgi:hypothetical protein